MENTKLIEIKLVAITRMEYTETIRVPTEMSESDLDKLVSKRYQDVDSSDFTVDNEYWERGACEHSEVSAAEAEDPTYSASVLANGTVAIKKLKAD